MRKKELWDMNFIHTEEYYRKHGNYNVPCHYLHPGKKGLYDWLRRIVRDYKEGKLDSDEIKRYKRIGLDFEDDRGDSNYDASIIEAIILYYVKKYDSDAIKLNKSDWLGVEIDVYIPSKKTAIEYDGYQHKNRIEEDENKNKLCHQKDIRIIRIRDKSLNHIKYCDRQFTVNPNRYVSELGNIMEDIIFDIYGVEATCDIQKDFDDIIVLRDEYDTIRWNQVYEKLISTIELKGLDYINNQIMDYSECINYKRWIDKLREDKLRNQRIKQENSVIQLRINLLEEIGIPIGNEKDNWYGSYAELTKYYISAGDLKVPARYTTENGISLGRWLITQRENRENGKLSSEKIRLINALANSCNW